MEFYKSPLTQRNRTAAYLIHVSGAVCAVLLLVLHYTTVDRHGFGVLVGGAAGGLLAALMPSRMDEYFHSLCNWGYRFVTFLTGAYLFVSWLVFDLHDHGKSDTALAQALSDPMLVATCAALAYYLGFGFAWLRNR